MDDHIRILSSFRQMSAVRNIPHDQPATVFPECLFQPGHILGRATPAEIVVNGHVLAARKQSIDIVRSDETGSAGD